MPRSKSSSLGADWTRLLADPDLLAHLGELLQTYRDATPERRDEALLAVLRKIKHGKGKAARAGASSSSSLSSDSSSEASGPRPASAAPETLPPFEPSVFSLSPGQDRRRHPRLKCFVAVELRPEGSSSPIWGNLANTSLGGCLVETATPVPTGVNLEVGLWLANGKIWVKGMVLNGVATRSNPAVRIRFADLDITARENLRQFLKYVESTTHGYASEHGYLAQLKR
jgi:PilZ domain